MLIDADSNKSTGLRGIDYQIEIRWDNKTKTWTKVFQEWSSFGATKQAIAAFSEGLRKELSPEYKIRVTCIEPGAVSTELLETITDESMAKIGNHLRHYGVIPFWSINTCLVIKRK